MRPKIKRQSGNTKDGGRKLQPSHEIEVNQLPELPDFASAFHHDPSLFVGFVQSQEIEELSTPPGVDPSFFLEFDPSLEPEPLPAPPNPEFLRSPFWELAIRIREAGREPIPHREMQKHIASIGAVFADQVLILMDLPPKSLIALGLEARRQRFQETMDRIRHDRLTELMTQAERGVLIASGGAIGIEVWSVAVEHAFDRRVKQLVFPDSLSYRYTYSGISSHAYKSEFFTGAKLPPSLPHPELANEVRKMVEVEKRLFIKDDIRYVPLALAAKLAQAPRQTMLNWIKNKTEFSGRPLQSYYLAPVDRYFVSEESIQRIAERFVKWPSQEKAAPVTLGETRDQSGFLTMSDAARIIGISPRTMWLWASQGKAPTSSPLDVVKCTTSDHFYIREKNVRELKKLVPRSGLQRGRRSHILPNP